MLNDLSEITRAKARALRGTPGELAKFMQNVPLPESRLKCLMEALENEAALGARKSEPSAEKQHVPKMR
jgi:NifU-like protein involved in Fe-S cluster formation